MEKTKLIEARRKKGYSQLYVAEELGIDESNYSRRENGVTRTNLKEWVKLSQILEVPMEEIYEEDENQLFIQNNHAPSNYQGNNNIQISSEVIELFQKQGEHIAKLLESHFKLVELMNKKN